MQDQSSSRTLTLKQELLKQHLVGLGLGLCLLTEIKENLYFMLEKQHRLTYRWTDVGIFSNAAYWQFISQ